MSHDLMARFSRRSAVAVGFLSALGLEATYGAKIKPRKKRRECRKGQLHCEGRCWKKKRSICCKTANGEAVGGKNSRCCPITPEDPLGGACPASNPVCCRTLRDGIYERSCHPEGTTCCPITDEDPAGGACTADYPVCVPSMHDGVPVRGCTDREQVRCPITPEDQLGGSCPADYPVCCPYLPEPGGELARSCAPAGWNCCPITDENPVGSSCPPERPICCRQKDGSQGCLPTTYTCCGPGFLCGPGEVCCDDGDGSFHCAYGEAQC